METPKIELPCWLPWATAAVLAALAACLFGLWTIEKGRNRLLKEEGQLAASAMKATDNQLEAERIISRREIETLRSARAGRALRVMPLVPSPPEDPHRGSPMAGAVAWDSADGTGVIRISCTEAQTPARDYQLWLEGPAPGLPARCAVFHSDAGDSEAEFRLDPAAAADPGSRFLLIDGPKGGSATLAEARAGGPIVLASPLPRGRISP